MVNNILEAKFVTRLLRQFILDFMWKKIVVGL